MIDVISFSLLNPHLPIPQVIFYLFGDGSTGKTLLTEFFATMYSGDAHPALTQNVFNENANEYLTSALVSFTEYIVTCYQDAVKYCNILKTFTDTNKSIKILYKDRLNFLTRLLIFFTSNDSDCSSILRAKNMPNFYNSVWARIVPIKFFEDKNKSLAIYVEMMATNPDYLGFQLREYMKRRTMVNKISIVDRYNSEYKHKLFDNYMPIQNLDLTNKITTFLKEIRDGNQVDQALFDNVPENGFTYTNIDKEYILIKESDITQFIKNNRDARFNKQDFITNLVQFAEPRTPTGKVNIYTFIEYNENDNRSTLVRSGKNKPVNRYNINDTKAVIDKQGKYMKLESRIKGLKIKTASVMKLINEDDNFDAAYEPFDE
jgi:hypothetical protein